MGTGRVRRRHARAGGAQRRYLRNDFHDSDDWLRHRFWRDDARVQGCAAARARCAGAGEGAGGKGWQRPAYREADAGAGGR